ncbi:odorant receptor Or2-like [Harpegnathos saltator]|uniref:odorant receptor Or2-like n=1 Tax=Harpegnathos saltator TaxID=610380 RepID=UPI000DBED991|nr:odorant receptor Or2-like [Harpegnathos saltator]
MTDFEWAVSRNRLMLRIAGLWPPDNYDARKAVKSKIRLLYNFSIVFIVLAMPALISLIRVWGDMILMIENMQYTLPIMGTLFKICILWQKQKDLQTIVDMVASDWLKSKTNEEREVMLKRARIVRTIAMYGLFSTILTVTTAFSFTCFELIFRHLTNRTDAGKSLPIPLDYLYDVTKSPQYELTLVAQIFASVTCGCSYIGVDHFLGLLVLHVCGQLENLHSRLTYMDKYPNFTAALQHNVQDHVRLIRSIEIIDNAFDSMLLILVLYFAIIFCLQGFLIVDVVNRKGQLSMIQLLWFVVATLYVLLHMCFYCIVGEILVIQSEKIYQATYEYPWYNKEPEVAKSLILIMLRASKPLQITAGKTFPMTMATFCNLLKTSAGYISVLLANQN